MGQTTPSPEEHSEQLGLDRLIFFSDAVFAIAITLLALEIRLPAEGPLTNAELIKNLLALWPRYLGYLVSFLVIGVFWMSHHRKFRFIRAYDGNLMLLNLLLLMVIAFIPFPTSVISEYGNQAATIFYALVIILAGLFSIALWRYASYRNRLTDPTLDERHRRQELIGPLVVSSVFLVSIGVAFINADLAKFTWGIAAMAGLVRR